VIWIKRDFTLIKNISKNIVAIVIRKQYSV